MKKWIFAGISLAVLLAVWLGISVGTQSVAMGDTVRILANGMFGIELPDWITEAQVSIILSFRVPRVLLAFLAGASLSVCGGVMQSIVQNPLASPYTMGVSSGASLGAGLAIVFGFAAFGIFTLPVCGLAMGIVAMFAVVGFSSKMDKTLSGNTVILVGMVASLFLSAILTLMSSLVQEKMRAILLWQMGSFALRGYEYVLALLPFSVLCMLVLFRYAREMDILTLGDRQAAALGVQVKQVKRTLFICSSVLTGAAVSVSGVIGFVDLIAPHIARKLFGSAHHIVLPAAALIGGIFMVLADLLARILIPGTELPIGAITALAGTPFFAYIYFKRR